jgi:hypothetical protein
MWSKTAQLVFELVQRGSYYYEVVEQGARGYSSSRLSRYRRGTADAAWQAADIVEVLLKSGLYCGIGTVLFAAISGMGWLLKQGLNWIQSRKCFPST